MHLTDDMRGKYGYFRDVNIMIFFGFGMLMTFLRRYGYAEDAAAFSCTPFKRPRTLKFHCAFELISESRKQTISNEVPV